MRSVPLEIPLQVLTENAFAPFGLSFSEGMPAHKFTTHPYHEADLHFALEGGTPAVYIVRFPEQPMVVTEFERHLRLTEVRIALGTPAVFVVAGDTDLCSRHQLPARESVRAFLIPEGTGVVLKAGTWHGLSCFPVGAAAADFAFVSERETEEELLTIADHGRLERTHIIDFATVGVAFQITDPSRLLDADVV